MNADELLPHAGDMCLIDELLAHGDGEALARVSLANNHPFLDGEGRVPAWVGLEMMAQTVAAWAGARGREQGMPPRKGYLLACRSFDAEQAAFEVPGELEIRVRELMRQDNGFGSYSGEIHAGGHRVARGKLSVMEMADSGEAADNEEAE